MSTHEKETFLQTYEWAKGWHELPWAHDEPTLFLANICQQEKPGKALDIGCGAGTDSVYLATKGWDVTALDFIPKALEFTQQRARAAGVSVTPVEADITAWQPDRKYDLILDHGLLHNMDPVRYAAYRESLMNALGDEGIFVLLHWHPLFPGQPDGEVGPTRVSREDIKAFFAPEFQERFFAREEFEDLPQMVGRGMSQAYYWFARNQAYLKPDELIEQIKATLQRHGCDADALIADAGDAPLDRNVSDELLARVLGPGRLGISHMIADTDDVGQLIRNLADWSGKPERYIENLLRVFASEEHGKVCTDNAKCTECDVTFCKRLRYR